MSFEKPYEGLRVVDLSQGVAGPYCAMLLARYGADVIKVEPLDGDWARMLAPIYGDHTAFSIAANIGKRSLAVDLKADFEAAIVDEFARLAQLVERRRYELLATEPRVHRHDQHHIDFVHNVLQPRERRCRIEYEPRLTALIANQAQ